MAPGVRAVVAATGASVSTMGADEHDAAVAVVSHVPQVAASLVAARLRAVPDPAEFVGRAPQQVEDFVSECVGPVRKRYPALLGQTARLEK